jgi:hypothetical protein
MKKNKRDEPIRITIHIYMEMSQGNSLCSYLKQAKMSFFFPFSSTNSEKRRAGRGRCYQWEEGSGGERV